MTSITPTLSLWLSGETTIQLGRKAFSGSTPTLQVHMHDTSQAATIVLPCYHSSTRTFDLRLALQSGIFDITDVELKTKIPVPYQDAEAEELVVKAGAPLRLFDLVLDPWDEFWSELLVPGRSYKIGWAQDDNAPWVYRGDMHSDAPERLLIRLGTGLITYHVLEDSKVPAVFSVSMKPTDSICHMNGKPRFGFELSVTLHYDYLVTVCLNKTPLKELHGLEDIVHVEDENGQEVEFDWGIGCWEGPEPFPPDTMFQEFEPGVPFEKTFWLDERAENDWPGDLTDLEVGKRYTVKVSGTLLGSFYDCKKGTKEELLAGSEKEKEERWAKRGERVFVEASDPFTFETV